MKRIQDNINSKKYWNSIYSSREDRHEHADKHKLMDMVYSIEEGKSVLDVGCGTGHLLREIKRHRPTCELTGVDYSDVVINRLKQTTPNIEWLTEMPKGKYDYVVTMETLEHIEDPENFLKTLADVTKWRLIITTPYKNRVPSCEHTWSFDGDDIKKILEEWFKKVWVMPVGSGGAVSGNGKILQHEGNWDILYIKAER